MHIKRCPFCGSEKVYSGGFKNDCRVYCGSCGGAGGVRATKTIAVAAWNQRYELGASPEAYTDIPDRCTICNAEPNVMGRCRCPMPTLATSRQTQECNG